MKKKLIAAIAAVAIAVGALAISVTAGEGSGKAHGQQSLDGTYELVQRVMQDGTILKPPAITGLLMYANGYRNFNLMWTGPDGQEYSISKVAKFTFDGHNYTEKNVAYFQNLPEEAGGMMYDLSATSGKAVVKHIDTGFVIQFPLHDEPLVTFSRFGIDAEREGDFHDFWQKLPD